MTDPLYNLSCSIMTRQEYVPQLATLVQRPPAGREWWHEIKIDGYRIGCRIHKGQITLISRNGKDWTSHFPEVVEALQRLRLDDALLDGEVAALLPDGRSSFQALQNALHRTSGRATLVYFVFDLLRLEGESLETQPLSARKQRLAELLPKAPGGRIRLSEHIEGSGAGVLERACALGLEGIVSKRKDRPYHRGRTSEWVKAKCTQRQELVIGGFTDPSGTRAGLGALLIGYHANGEFVFAGKVGTGFTQKSAVELRRTLESLKRATSPFDVGPPRLIARHAHWVQPTLVCEVSFTEWTDDGVLRHPVFQGLRTDKAAAEVHRERAQGVDT